MKEILKILIFLLILLFFIFIVFQVYFCIAILRHLQQDILRKTQQQQLLIFLKVDGNELPSKR